MTKIRENNELLRVTSDKPASLFNINTVKMKKYTFLSIVLISVLSISLSAQNKEDKSQDKNKSTTTINMSGADSQAISNSLRIKPYKYNPVSLDGPRIIVIDGKVSERGFDEIDVKDIHSISVLKGEKAASLYGYKTASGVIVITTRRGENVTETGKKLNKK